MTCWPGVSPGRWTSISRILLLACAAGLGAAWAPAPSAAQGQLETGDRTGPPGSSVFWSGEFVDLAEVHAFDDNPEELRKTWEQGVVFVPGPAIGEFIFGRLGAAAVQRRLDAIAPGERYPLVIYFHDAAGPSVSEGRLLRSFEVENMAAIFPNSFARTDRRPDCDARTGACAMAPQIYLFRRGELRYAVKRARQLPWVDQDNIFLVGLGEGAAAIAIWGGDVDVAGYVIANWTCTAPPELPWFDGLRTPKNRPVLSINSGKNRWTDKAGWRGDCASKATGYAKVTGLVIDSAVENVFVLRSGKAAMIDFFYKTLHR